MIDIKSIPIPMLMADLKKDRRGFPVPYFQYVPDTFAVDGKIDFRIKDPLKVHEAVTCRLCGICGKRLGPVIFFIGGPDEINNNAFSDPGMHGTCARYAMAVCPFLANADYRPSGKAIANTVNDPTRSTFRPDVIVMISVRHYTVARVIVEKHFPTMVCQPVKPFIKIEQFK